MAKLPKTNAVRLVERSKVPYELRSYELAIEDFNATAVAELIGAPASQVFKTLVATSGDQACFAVLPGDSELDLKALAQAAGARKMTMMAVKDVEPLTGYRRGGVTALGSKKALPVYLDQSAMDHDVIGVSAGTKGLQMFISPVDYQRLTGAVAVGLARG